MLEYSQYTKYYSDSKFWKKLNSYAQKAGLELSYVALLLYYVALDPQVPFNYKMRIMGALGYLILPVDMIPDAFPVMGFSDDLFTLFAAVHSVSKAITQDKKDRAKQQLEKWFNNIHQDDINSINLKL